MISWNKKHSIVLFSIIILIGLGYYLLYSSLISPIALQKKNVENSIKTSNQLLAATESNSPASQVVTPYSLAELEKEIPTNRFEEEFLLDVEKAEIVSGSTVKDATFTDADFASQDTQADSSDPAAAQNSTASASQPNNGSPQAQAPAGDPSQVQLPNGMKKLTVAISTESPSFQDMRKFLDTLESLKRITQIEGITLEPRVEITSMDQKPEPLKYTATVSAFYMPNLPELKKQLPPFPKTVPANKENPFQPFDTENNAENP